MKIKAKDLFDRALDYAVALANGWKTFPTDGAEGRYHWYLDAEKAPHCNKLPIKNYRPSCDVHADFIIDREKIDTAFLRDTADTWMANIAVPYERCIYYGPTRRIAAMRCYVAAKLGEEVDIPEELL